MTGASQIIEYTSNFITPALELFLAVCDCSYSGQDSGVYNARSLASDFGRLSISQLGY